MEDKILLIKLVQGLKTLDESQFDYEVFVSEYDAKNNCGTVCCAWGWMPKFVPESGVTWNYGVINIPASIYNWNELTERQVDFMFYAENNPNGYHSVKNSGRTLKLH